MPLILIVWFFFELPARYSAVVTSMFMPVTSWKPPRTLFLSPVPISTRKLKLPYGSSLCVAISAPRRSGGGGRGPLADSEDDKLGGLGRRHPDEADEPAVVQVVLRHGRRVAPDVIRLFGLAAEQRAGLPLAEQEAFDGVPDRVPQGWPVDLENDPLGALVDRLLQVVEVPAHAEVLPLRVVADGARPPDEESGAREETQAVDALGVE